MAASMNAPAESLTRDLVSTIVFDVVSRVGELALDDLVQRSDADLVIDLGLDSIKLMQIWIEIERELSLQAGDIGISQASTSAAIIEHTVQELARQGGEA
jgi:acyl carrier protein